MNRILIVASVLARKRWNLRLKEGQLFRFLLSSSLGMTGLVDRGSVAPMSYTKSVLGSGLL